MFRSQLRWTVAAIAAVISLHIGARNYSLADDQQKKSSNTDPPAASANANSADQLETVHFVLHPAPLPYAVLKYRLLPRYLEQSPGNAAPLYMRASMVWTEDKAYQQVADKIDDWNELPLNEFAKNKELQDFFNATPTEHWDLIRLAARRENCDWELPIREYNIATLIPELQKMRNLATLVAFKARMEISRGQFDAAIETLKTGFALGRHVTQSPTLVNDLVGVAIAFKMLKQLETLIEQPKAPNFYWTLSSLPNPLIDLYAGLNAEQAFLYLYLPELVDVRTAEHTEAEWSKLLAHVVDKFIKAMDGISQKPADWSEWGTKAYYALTAYPKARAQLKAAGYSDQRIEAMPMAQAILIASVETYDHLRDDLNKWLYLPLADAERGIPEFEKELNASAECIPLARVLLPGLRNVKAVEVRLARQIAALRCVEALRLYAANHHGQLPKQWSDIKEVPIPDNPITGKPFDYVVHGDTATITSPPPLGQAAALGLSWEIKMELLPGKSN